MITVHVKVKGSGKSGNFGHAGRPGEVGGSSTSTIVKAKYTRLETMPTYQSGEYSNTPDVVGKEDARLKLILHDQGFDGKPEVGDRRTLDGYIKDGGIEVWRGLRSSDDSSGTGIQYAEQFRTGELFAGLGVHGSGTYTTVSRPKAESYSFEKGSCTLRMVLKNDSKIIKYDDAYSAMTKEGQGGGITGDAGRWAASHGYDAIWIPVLPMSSNYIILNRTAVAVDSADYHGADFPGR